MLKKIISIFLFVNILIFASPVFAFGEDLSEGTYNLDYVDDSNELVKAKKGAGLEDSIDEHQLTIQIAQMIRLFSSLLSVAFVIIVVYAGFLWVRGGNDPKNVDLAKKWIRNGVIGIFVVLAAYAISSTVISSYEAGVNDATRHQYDQAAGESDRERADRERGEASDDYINKSFWDRIFSW